MRNSEKIKGGYPVKIRRLENSAAGGCKFQDKTTECIIHGNDYKMTKMSVPELKATIITVEEI
jgi:hypothetical protein